MGTSGWEDDSWGRGRSARDGRSGERSSGSHDRGSRGASPARSYDRADRGSSRDADDMGGRGRSNGRPRDDDHRPSSSGGHSSRRSSRYDDEARQQEPSRSGSHGGHRHSSGEYGDREAGRGRSAGRDDRDRRGERAGDRSMRGERSGDRSMRGERSGRADTWEPARGKSAGGPQGSGGRHHAPGRGGLWDDDGETPHRRRDADPRGRSMGSRHNLNDPRALRRGLVDENAEEPEEETKGGPSFPKALLVVLVMLVIGGGAAFGYFKLSTPHAQLPAPAPTSTAKPATPPPATVTPAAPTETPQS